MDVLVRVLADLATDWRVAVRIALLPTLVVLVADTLLQTGGPDQPFLDPRNLFSMISFYGLVAVVAVAWHRHQLLSEVPAGVVPRVNWFRAIRYFLMWVLLGIGIMLLIGLPLLLVYGALSVLGADPILLQILEHSVTTDWVNWASLGGVLIAVLIWLYTVLFYRSAMGLPHLAVADTWLGIRASWAQTRPLAGQIAITCVFTTVLICAYATVSSYAWANFYYNWEAAGETWVVNWPVVLAMVAGFLLLDVLSVLIGAALLTVVYRATRPED